MAEVETFEFSNSPRGQAEKNRVLAQYLSSGWSIVSETVTPGHMRGGQACCRGIICLPWAFTAQRTAGTINVTLTREDRPPPALAELRAERTAGRFCPACGFEGAVEARWCASCGEKLSP